MYKYIHIYTQIYINTPIYINIHKLTKLQNVPTSPSVPTTTVRFQKKCLRKYMFTRIPNTLRRQQQHCSVRTQSSLGFFIQYKRMRIEIMMVIVSEGKRGEKKNPIGEIKGVRGVGGRGGG